MAVLWMLDTVLLSLSYAFLLMFAFKLLAETKTELAWLPKLVWALFGLWLGALLCSLDAETASTSEQDLRLARTFEAFYRYGFRPYRLALWGAGPSRCKRTSSNG